MQREEIYERIKEYLVRDFEIDPAEIRPEANLFADLELDSIDALDWFIKMEAELKITMDEKELRKVRTVQDVVNYVERYIGPH
jgi:acyl carrier protein